MLRRTMRRHGETALKGFSILALNFIWSPGPERLLIEDPILQIIHGMVSENESSNLILGDYAHALLHLVTLQQADEPSRLIFGLIEAFPTEIDPTPFSLVLQTLRCSGHRQFAFIRHNLPMAKALELYFKAMETAHITWPWSATHDSASTIAAPHLVAWTRWPNFLLSDTQHLPCIAPRWGKVRTHSLLAKDAEAVARLISDDKPAAWLGERLRFDLPGEWRELVGSLHLILPNPLYRRLQLRLLPATGDTAEAVRLGFIPRAGQAHELESTLTVQLSEHRHTGITNHRIDVSTNPMTIGKRGQVRIDF